MMRLTRILLISILCLWVGAFGGWTIAKHEKAYAIILTDENGYGYYRFKNLQNEIPVVIFTPDCRYYQVDLAGIEVHSQPDSQIILTIKYN